MLSAKHIKRFDDIGMAWRFRVDMFRKGELA